jgi:hypothetical protein
MSSSINKNVNVKQQTWDKDAYKARACSPAAAPKASSTPATAAIGDVDNNAVTVGIGVTAAIRAGIDPTEEKEEFLPAEQGRAGPMGLLFTCSGGLWWSALHLSQ